jgi:pimeloyl-ACP methyl ester carboxylesterase
MIPDFVDLWDGVSAIRCPVLLVRGGASSVVDDADVSEFSRRQPRARVEVVPGAGHSIQGDRPVELAQLLNAFLKEA